MDTTTAKRSCKATTQSGKPCKAAPLADGDCCLAHADEETRANSGFGGAFNGAKGGRPRKLREVDVIRENIEANVGAIDRLLQEAERADRAVVVGNGPTAHVEYVPDWPVRIAAARERLDRGYGRPVQISEVTVISESEMDAAIRRMEEQLGANDPDRSGDPTGEDRALQGAAAQG